MSPLTEKKIFKHNKNQMMKIFIVFSPHKNNKDWVTFGIFGEFDKTIL